MRRGGVRREGRVDIRKTKALIYLYLDLVLSGCWNWDGSEVLFSLKNKTIIRCDPRYGAKLDFQMNSSCCGSIYE